jgi:4-oxalmesaconate hydratase
MVELDVPAMVHVSGSCNPTSTPPGRTTSTPTPPPSCNSLQGDLFSDFPDLRLIIPHGGGAVPYHWGRYRGLADMLKPPTRGTRDEQRLLRHLRLSPAGHRPLVDVIDVENILFGSEMLGAVRGVDPETGFYFDDTKRYVDAAASQRRSSAEQIFSGNARTGLPASRARPRRAGARVTTTFTWTGLARL